MNNIRWMSLYGRFETGGESIRFIPLLDSSAEAEVEASAAEVASNLDFAQGDVSFDVVFKDQQSVATVVFNTTDAAAQLHVGLNLGGAYGVATYADGWNILKSVGAVNQLRPEQVYHVRVSVRGAQIRLYVNEVLVLEADAPVSRSPIHLYGYGKSEIVFSRFSCDRPTVFVALSDDVAEWCGRRVESTITEALFQQTAVNLDYSPIEEVQKAVQQAVCVVTNVSPEFAQGLYNVGLAHGASKPAVILCHKSHRGLYSFGAQSSQTIYFDESSAALENLLLTLKKYLQTVV